MEWVETTAKSIEEAQDFLLDQLGVAEDEAEFEVLEEPKAGLFGRQRGVARVRARIAPNSPRTKENPRRKPRSKSSGDAAAAGSTEATKAPSDAPPRERAPRREATRSEDALPPEPFIAPLTAFLEQLVSAAGLTATVEIVITEEQALVASINGDGLGSLIGPGGGVIDAVQELSRTFLQKEAQGGMAPRLKVDVAGYRIDRATALDLFTKELASTVMETGTAHGLEVMGSSDRKTVHDAVNDIDGVTSSSQGVDPDRYVVISPA